MVPNFVIEILYYMPKIKKAYCGISVMDRFTLYRTSLKERSIANIPFIYYFNVLLSFWGKNDNYIL